MKAFYILLFVVTGTKAFASLPPQACAEAQFFCAKEFTYNYSVNNCTDTTELWFYFNAGSTVAEMSIASNDSIYGYTIIGPFAGALTQPCNALDSTTTIDFTVSSTKVLHQITMDLGGSLPVGYYYVRVKAKSCKSSISFISKNEYLTCPEIPCENCIGSFQLEPGKKYVLSLWTKESGAAPTKTSYDRPSVQVGFPSLSLMLTSVYPTGQIIDGWQRIETEFTVPISATNFQLKLSCSTGDCYFDDLRIHPFEGSMKTYVYDPVNLRLVAELDERNYATFYEYDEEGKLLRIKKETERGIMTIQESKSSLIKN